jgi:plastocyanin
MAKSANILAALIIIGLTTGARAQSAGPVEISLTDYAFTPAQISLKAGTTYRLHFINAGSKEHDFTAPEFFAAAQAAPDDQAKIKAGKITIDKGQQVDVTVTPAAGLYKVSCTHFMHSMMGMHGTIAVE